MRKTSEVLTYLYQYEEKLLMLFVQSVDIKTGEKETVQNSHSVSPRVDKFDTRHINLTHDMNISTSMCCVLLSSLK